MFQIGFTIFQAMPQTGETKNTSSIENELKNILIGQFLSLKIDFQILIK